MKSISRILAVCFTLLTIISIPVAAQDVTETEFNTSKTEVNIAIANIFSKNSYWQLYYLNGSYFPYVYENYYIQPELVIGIKLHSNKGAFRISTNLKYSNITNENDGGQTEKYTFKNYGSTLFLGYEWHSSFNRVNIFYGFDVSTSYITYVIEQENTSSYPQGHISSSKSSTFENTFGINPLIGLNFYITPHLSIGTEAKFTLEYVSGKTEYESSDNLNNENTKSSGIRTRFGPIGFLSINLHL